MFVFIQKKYPENFAFLFLKILELYTRKVCEMFVYKHFKRNVKTLQVNNSRILAIKNAKFPGYYFHMKFSNLH